MKKVLIITYYWPPAGGPGVQRVLKFVKYLPQFGWEPIILTVENGEYPAVDASLLDEIPKGIKVYKTKALEPNSIYKKITGMHKNDNIPVAVLTDKNVNWKKKIANWIRLTFFIPDAKIGWIPFAVNQGKKIIKKHKPDIIFSSSPPPTVHLIAKRLAKWSGLKWVSDFRDPWTNIYHYHNNEMATIASYFNKSLERSVLKSADTITVVNNGFFETDNDEKFQVLANGYDPEDLPVNANNEKTSFTISYFGSYKINQHFEQFYKVLNDLGKRYSLTLNFIGNVDKSILKKINTLNTDFTINFFGYMEHRKALKTIQNSDLLLLIIGKSIISKQILSGKLFDYLLVNRSILAIGPKNGAVDQLLNKTGAGKLFDYNDIEGIKSFIITIIQDGQLKYVNSNEIERFNRKKIAEELSLIFNRVL